MRRLRKFFGLPWRDKLMLAEAVVTTSVASTALLLLPFRWIAPWLGRHMQVSSESQTADAERTAHQVRAAIRVASRYVCWKPQCLAQAIAATTMLRLRRIEGTVYLGMAKDGESELTAHAWLRSGTIIVTGSQGYQGQSVVSTFAFPRKS